MASVSKEALLKIVGDDTDAEEKLDRISAKADKLREEHPELTVRVDTAEASAKLAVFREELKAATRSMTADVDAKGGKGGLLSRLLYGADFAGGGGGSGDVGGVAGALPEFLSGPMLAGIAVAVPLLFALLTEVTGLVAGFAALGAGAVAFGALAYPAIKSVETAWTNISTAQAAYNTAVTKEKLDPTAANATAVKTALVNLKVAQDQAGPSTTKIIGGIHQLTGEFSKMATAFQPEVLKVFNDALKVANNLLPTLKAPATDFGNALDGLLKQLDKFTKSKGFKEWLGQFDKLIGPATTAIGEGIGKTAGALGKLFTTMSAHDVVHTINIAFDILAGTINVISDVVKRLMHNWDEMSSGIAAFSRRSQTDLANWAQDVDNFVSRAAKDVENWAKDFARYFYTDPHNFLVRAQTDLANWAQDVDNFVSRAAKDVENWAKDFARYFYTDPHNFLVRAQTDLANWAQDVDNAVSAAVRWFEGLPGKIVSAVGNLGGLLVHAGESIIDGLVSGVESKVGGLLKDISGIAGKVASAFGSILGIHSPSTVFAEHGRDIIAGLEQGLNGAAPNAYAAMSRVASGLSLGGGGGAGGGALGIQLSLAGGTGNQFESLLLQSMRAVVLRNGGGGKNSVQRALGQTS